MTYNYIDKYIEFAKHIKKHGVLLNTAATFEKFLKNVIEEKNFKKNIFFLYYRLLKINDIDLDYIMNDYLFYLQNENKKLDIVLSNEFINFLIERNENSIIENLFKVFDEKHRKNIEFILEKTNYKYYFEFLEMFVTIKNKDLFLDILEYILKNIIKHSIEENSLTIKQEETLSKIIKNIINNHEKSLYLFLKYIPVKFLSKYEILNPEIAIKLLELKKLQVEDIEDITNKLDFIPKQFIEKIISFVIIKNPNNTEIWYNILLKGELDLILIQKILKYIVNNLDQEDIEYIIKRTKTNKNILNFILNEYEKLKK